MLFKPKFFLDLSGGDQAESPPVVIAPVKKQEQAEAKPAQAQKAAPAQVTATAESTPATKADPSGASLTTAEAIAAELAAAQANRPAPSLATFAPDCLVAGAAVPRRRRLAGANLGAFKQMAQGMMKS
jgi:hypothetical protein